LRGETISIAQRTAPLAEDTAQYLKTLGHAGRLMIMCHLANGEKSVGDLEELLGIRQSAVSQQLGRLRAEGMVRTRRSGKAIYYSLSDNRAIDAINCVLQHDA